jgi:hypothetical protein
VDLNVVGAAIPTPGTNGEQQVFQYTVTNQGAAAATTASLAGTFPTTGATYVSISTTKGTATADASAGTFTATIGGLAIGESAIVRIVMTAAATGTLASTATASNTAEPEIFTGNNTASISVTINAPTVLPGSDVAPTVNLLRRFGVSRRPASLVVGYSTPLTESTATDLANYKLVTAGRDGRFGTADDVAIALATATYNVSNSQVTLTTRRPYSLHTPVRLTINGTTGTPVAGIDGLALDGGFTGTPGSNYVRVFRAFGPGPVPGAQAILTGRARRS